MTPWWFNLDHLPKLASNVTDLFVVSNVQLGYLQHFQLFVGYKLTGSLIEKIMGKEKSWRL